MRIWSRIAGHNIPLQRYLDRVEEYLMLLEMAGYN